jgi:hypothetical protein
MTVQLHVRDRRTELAEHIQRAAGAYALGETYWFEIMPIAVQSNPVTDPNAVEVAYMLAISCRAPVPIGAYLTVTSKPFQFMAGEEPIGELVRTMIDQLRRDLAESVRLSAAGS